MTSFIALFSSRAGNSRGVFKVVLPGLAVALWLSACTPAAEPPVATRPVLVMTVKSSVLSDIRSLPGVVVARYASDIAFQAGGRIGKRSVEVGQLVRKGQPLLQLDESDYTLALSAAQDQAAAAKAQADQATSDQQRFSSLVADGAVSVADNERQKARAETARAQYQQASRQVQLSRNRARYATLVAPYDGVVTALRAEAGQVVAEGQSVVSMAQLGEYEIAVDIPESLVSKLSLQQAQAQVWGTSVASYALLLRELAPAAAQPLRTYRARFSLHDVSAADRAQLRLGMTAQVQLGGVSAATTAVNVPASALVKADGQSSVWLVDNSKGRLLRQPVQVVSYDNETAAVTGLQDGMQVVITGVQKLDGQVRVRAVPRSGSGLDVGVGAGVVGKRS